MTIVFYFKLIGEENEYFSSDSIDISIATDFDAFEHLPNHSIKLKIDSTIMLMRNLDPSEGLCYGTRLTVTRFTNHVIEAKIISGKI